MNPKKYSDPGRGPVGKDEEGNLEGVMPEHQERYEENKERMDVVGAEPPQDPTELRAHEEDHTPNFTREARQSKPLYGRYKGHGSGGVGL